MSAMRLFSPQSMRGAGPARVKYRARRPRRPPVRGARSPPPPAGPLPRGRRREAPPLAHAVARVVKYIREAYGGPPVSARSRYPLTSTLVTPHMHDVLVCLAENTCEADKEDPFTKGVLVIRSLAAVEQFCRALDERCSGRGGDAGGAGTTAGPVGGARAGAPWPTDDGLLDISPIMALAERPGLESLSRWLDTDGNSEALARAFEDRNTILREINFLDFDAAAVCSLARSLVLAVLADWPKDLVACMLIEAHRMDAVGRPDDARRAYESVVDMCDRVIAPGGGGA